MPKTNESVASSKKPSQSFKINNPEKISSQMTIPFHKSTVTEEEEKAVLGVLRSKWLTTGIQTKKFESEFAEYTNCKYAIAVNSCTAAMHVALSAYGITKDDEVITTPYTFIATVEAIEYVGAIPVLVDVDDDFNISIDMIKSALTKKTRAIIPVHIAGNPCNMEVLRSFADENSLFLLQDAAHAIESYWNGKHVSEFGDVAAFSFYATKNITTAGEGGMLVTNNESIAKRSRRLVLHGINKDAYQRYIVGGKWKYEVVELGFKYNMTDVAASMGRVQLKRVDTWHIQRQTIVAKYNEVFSQLRGLIVPKEYECTQHAWHLYILRINPENFVINRDEMVEKLDQTGVSTSVHFIPVHHHPYYKCRLIIPKTGLPNTDRLYTSAITLPLYPSLTDHEVDYIINKVSDLAKTFQK